MPWLRLVGDASPCLRIDKRHVEICEPMLGVENMRSLIFNEMSERVLDHKKLREKYPGYGIYRDLERVIPIKSGDCVGENL